MNIWLGLYFLATPGTDILDNTTSILGESSEPQPDAALAILPECGGQTHEDEDGNLIVGSPELIVEVALRRPGLTTCTKSDAITNRPEWGKYIVLVFLAENRIVWWVRRGSGFELLEPGPDGRLPLRILRRLTLPHLAARSAELYMARRVDRKSYSKGWLRRSIKPSLRR